MADISREIEERIRFLNAVIEEKKTSLKSCPDGSLQINKCKGTTQYYCNLKGGRGKIYLKKSEEEMIRALAQKDYDLRVLRAAIRERDSIISAAKRFDCIKVEDIFDELSPERQKITVPVILPDDLFIKNWESYQYMHKPFKEDYPEYYTAKGERVRSKSEVIIADLLNKMSIPYRYECPLTFRSGITIHPDFTVLNVRKRKTMYLEHFGMADDPLYVGNAAERVSLYEGDGIFPGDRLVITFETGKRPLNVKNITAKFNFYFL